MVDQRAQAYLNRGRVLRNIASNYAGQIIALGTGFLLTPFVLARLGAATFGLWALIGSVMGYTTLLDLGISGAIIKYVAEHHARAEMEQAHALVATASWIYTGLGLATVLLSVALAGLLPTLFNLPAEQRATAYRLVLVMGVSAGILIPCTVPKAVLRGLQRYDVVNGVASAGALAGALATVIVLLLGGGVVGMVAANIPITLLMQGANVWFINRIAPDLRLGWGGATRSQVRKMAVFSSSIFVMNVTGQIQTKTDEIVIGAILPMSAVTPYSIARRLSEMPLLLTNQFMAVLLPMASVLNAGDDRARLRALYITSSRLTLAIFLAVSLPLMLLAQQILAAWVGKEYGAYAYLVVILTLASLIDTSQWPAGAVLQGMARHQPLAIIAVFAALSNLVLSVILAHRIGLAGVAIGTLFPTTVFCLGFVLPFALRAVGVRAREAIQSIFLPALLPALPAAVALYLLREALAPSSWPALFATAGIGFCAYLAGYLVLGAGQAEKEAAHHLLTTSLRLAGRYLPSGGPR